MTAARMPAMPAPPATRRVPQMTRAWDFRNPEKLSKDHIRSLYAIHQNFSRLAATALSGRLRTAVSLRLSSVDQALYQDYVALLPERCVLGTVGMAPLPGRMVLEVAPELALCMVERLIGGDGRGVELDRELSDIDLGLLRALMRTLLEALKETWSPIEAVDPALLDLVDGAELAHAAAPGDSVVIVLIEVTVSGRTGSLSICLPHRLLEPIIPRLSPQLWSALLPRPPDDETRSRLETSLRAAPVRVTAVAGETEIRLSELMALRRGDVLLFGSGRDLVAGIKVADRLRFRGHPGLVGGRVAVKIDRIEGLRRDDHDTPA